MSAVADARVVRSSGIASQKRRPAVVALARVEGRRLLRHPIFLAGAALSAVWVVVVAQLEPSVYWLVTGAGVWPLGLATLLVVDSAALRSRRDETEELYRSLPASARARTAGHLLSVLSAVAATVLVTGAELLFLGGASGGLETDEGTEALPGVFELAQGPIGVAMLGALGVALARWLPWLLVGPAAVVAIFASGDRFVQPIGSEGWNLLYLIGLAAVFAALALPPPRWRLRPLRAH